MSSRSSAPVFAVILVIAVIAAAGYAMSRTGIVPAPSATSTAPTASMSVDYATSSADATSAMPSIDGATTSAAAIPLPSATSTIDMSGWQSYTDAARSFSLLYPPDLVRTAASSGATSFAFPSSAYFHWPLLDTAAISVSVGQSCPAMRTGAGPADSADSASFSLGGLQWTRSVGHDVGAGQRSLEVAYDAALPSGACASIDFTDRGANGAGFYVSDQSLIQKYDAAHSADLTAVIAILNGMVGSFAPASRP